MACRPKETEALLSFYDFPAENWNHLRTSNPIESVFATVGHRTVRTNVALPQKIAMLTVLPLIGAASKTWRKLTARTSCRASNVSYLRIGAAPA